VHEREAADEVADGRRVMAENDERRRRRATRQAGVASLALFALQSREVGDIIARAVAGVADALSVPVVAVIRPAGPGRAVLVRGHGPLGVGHDEAFEVGDDSWTIPVLPDANGSSLRQHASRPTPPWSVSSSSARVPVSLSVGVPVEGDAWGHLVVVGADRWEPDDDAAEFLWMVSAVVGAAIERDRVDRRAAALTALERFARVSDDVSAVVAEAVETLRTLTDVPACAALRLLPEAVSTATILHSSGPLDIGTGSGYPIDPALATALYGLDVLHVENWAGERFDTALTPRADQSVAVLSPAVIVDGRVWARLAALDVTPRSFSTAEIDAARRVADLLAGAVDRGRDATARATEQLWAGGGPVPERAATEVALVDRAGIVVWVNDVWEQFCRDNGGDPARTGVGMSYLDLCDVAGDPTSEEVGDAVRAAISGDLPAPMVVVIPCHSPDEERWYDLLISSRLDDRGRPLGATITLSRNRR
jgi:GAF domain-containing protein